MMYYRTIEDNKRLKKLYKKTFNSYGNGAYYDKDKERYIKYCAWSIPYKKVLKNNVKRKSDVCHCLLSTTMTTSMSDLTEVFIKDVMSYGGIYFNII